MGTVGLTLGGHVSPAAGSGNRKVGATGDCNSIATCYTPQQLEVAYGVTPLLSRGINGRGETVVFPELAYPVANLPVSDLRADFKQFDTLFKLPSVKLRFINSLTHVAQPWLANGEEVLDTEAVHAIAPGAAITVVLVKATSLNDTASAVAAAVSALRLAPKYGSIISISAAGQTGGEHCDSATQVSELNAALTLDARQHVSVVVASGDVGSVSEPCHVIKGLIGGNFPPVKEVNLPAADPLVLSVGGTSLSASHKTGAYLGETAWGLPYGTSGSQFQASGGGFSTLFARPAFQAGVLGIGSYRGVPDVSADASPHSGMTVVVSNGSGYNIVKGGGTSQSAPIWAGIIALADQYAGRPLGDVNPAIYAIGKSATYHRAFHDVTTGNNAPVFQGQKITGYRAVKGWDPVTGWGSPDAQVLVPLFKQYDQG